MSDSISKYDLFLSYNSQDRDEVQAIRQQLGKLPQALTAFLDRESLTLGKRWFEEIESALLNSHAIALFYGPHGLGRWQNLEMILALDLQANPNADILVIPVLLPGADLSKAPRFLLLNSYLDLRSGHDSTSLSRLAQHVLRQPATLDALSANDELRNPYRGLNYFQEQDAPLFFGRQYESKKLLEKVKTSSLIALVGNSGSGKSSVVRAGLIPLLRKQHMPDQTWDVLVCIPALDNANPFHNLAAAFLESWGNSPDEVVEKRPGIEATLRHTLSLVDSIRQTLKKSHDADKLLLIIDQFEELLNFDNLDPETVDDLKPKPKPKTDFELFVELLLKAANTDHCAVLLTIRGDYYGAVTERHARLAEKIEKGTVTLSRLQDDQLRDIIVKPAELAGGHFEDGLPDRIIDDVGKKPGNLALLEFALTSLWNYQSQGWLKLSAYQNQVGKLEGAISAEADKILQSDKVPDPTLALAALTRLVRVSSTEEDGGDTRQRVPLTEFSDAEKTCLKPFIKKHLLLASGTWKDNGDADQQPDGQDPSQLSPTLEVAHEALIRHWPTLQEALKDKREVLVWRQTIRQQYERWQQLKLKKVSPEQLAKWLLQGYPLERGLQWLRERPKDLTGEEEPFIIASHQQLQHQQRWLKRGRYTLVFVGVGLLLATLIQFLWINPNQASWNLAARALWIRTSYGVFEVRPDWLPEMKTIGSGTFQMGSSAEDIENGSAGSDEGPRHSVTFAAPFAIGVYEIKFSEYQVFVHDTQNNHFQCQSDQKPKLDDNNWGFDDRPAINVSWDDATCYAKWLSLLTGNKFLMCQHFSGHMVKQLCAAIRSLLGTNSHWQNAIAPGCKKFQYIRTQPA
ncbi:MAG: SUMF1/EgtB/PvdO family nonheme iron enzyme [Methylococcaceae bacterium]|nr:SUMF1/EgtB/PvdO family nonheme iron enzyme [Methylococcaceae bacterium]